MKQVKLTDLVDVQILQNLQDAFSEYTGVAALMMDEKGRPLTRESNFSGLCKNMVRQSETGLARCEECVRKAVQECVKTGKASVYRCHAGLIEFAVPIMADGKVVASFTGGQVRNTDQPDEEMRRIADSLGLEAEAFLAETKKTPVITREQVVKTAIYLRKIAEALSGFAYQSYQIFIASRNEEEEAMARNHYMEGLYTDIAGDIKEWTRDVEKALESEDCAEYKRIMLEMKRRGNDVQAFIRDTLVTIRQTKMSLHLTETAYAPAELVGEIAERVRPLFDGRGNVLKIEIGEDVPQYLYGDIGRIRRILTALLYEACEHTDHGEVALRFGMKKKEYALYPEICIEDGEIDCENARYEHMEDYIQGRGAQPEESVQIGAKMLYKELYAVDAMLGQMFGSLSVVSERGKGNSCRLSFPQLAATPEKNSSYGGAGQSEKTI